MLRWLNIWFIGEKCVQRYFDRIFWWEDWIKMDVNEIPLGTVDCMEVPEKQDLLLAVLNLRDVFPIYSISQWSLVLPYLRMTRPVNDEPVLLYIPGPDISGRFQTPKQLLKHVSMLLTSRTAAHCFEQAL
jgi:hypothetical protein